MVQDRDRTWCGVAEAARRLGVSERAVRKRIETGRIDARRETIGNRTRTVVSVPAPAPGSGPHAAPVRDLDVQLARLEERLAAAEAGRAELRAEVAWLRARLEAELARRRRWRWPGVAIMWRRFWQGEG